MRRQNRILRIFAIVRKCTFGDAKGAQHISAPPGVGDVHNNLLVF